LIFISSSSVVFYIRFSFSFDEFFLNVIFVIVIVVVDEKTLDSRSSVRLMLAAVLFEAGYDTDCSLRIDE